MRIGGIFIFLLIVSLPLLGAVGHDLYLNYQEQGDKYEEYKLSAVGYLWTTYDEESYKTTRETLGPEDWKALDKWVLDQKTVVVGGVFAGFFYIITFLLWMLGVGPFKREVVSQSKAAKKVDVMLGEAKTTKYKYKKK